MIESPPWTDSPDERNPDYFRCWQRVSIALQKNFRAWASEIYFRDPTRFENREAGYIMIVFSASRPCYGRPRFEFTWDVADPRALTGAWRSLGNSLRTALAPIEKRLRESGNLPLARRYAPVWHQDILMAVKSHARPFIRMLALESKLVDAVIDLGTRCDPDAVRRFHRAATHSLRGFHNTDMTELLPKLLAEATRVLTANAARRLDHLAHRGIPQHHHPFAARSPYLRIR
jgi:hypothetical protein